MEIIVGRQGTNQKITILDRTVSRQHCKLTPQSDGTYLLENISANGTFVDGRSVVKTVVTKDTTIQLGPSYKVKVADIVVIEPNPIPSSGNSANVATPKPQSPQSPNPEPVPEFSVRTLQYIWDEYQRELDEIKEKQKSITLLRTSAPLFTMGSAALAGLAKSCDWDTSILTLSSILTFVGLILMVYAFIKSSKDDSEDRRKEALEKFQSHYVCPNPKCGHTHVQSPKILLQNKTCPYCRCKYIQ